MRFSAIRSSVTYNGSGIVLLTISVGSYLKLRKPQNFETHQKTKPKLHLSYFRTYFDRIFEVLVSI